MGAAETAHADYYADYGDGYNPEIFHPLHQWWV